MVGALNWTYSDSGLVSGAYPTVREWWIWRGISPPPVILSDGRYLYSDHAGANYQPDHAHTTPIISGVITAALASGQYVKW